MHGWILQLIPALMMVCMTTGGCTYDYPKKEYVPAGIERHGGHGTPADAAETELTLVTYNVANMGHGGDRLDDIARFIEQTGADFAGLNEVDSCNQRHSNFQLKDVAEKLGGWSYHFASAFDFAGGGYGNGALCNKPLLDAYTLPIPRGSGHEPRSVAVIETEDIVFCATHLDFGPPGEPSYEQAVYLNRWFGEHYDNYGKPVIICGDFNTDPGTATIDEMDRCWTRLSRPELSWPSNNPTMCLDYFFCYNGAVPVEVVDNARPEGIVDYTQTSDHLPVVVKIRITRPHESSTGGRQNRQNTPVSAVKVFGSAANNATSVAPLQAYTVSDADGFPLENVFEIYLGPKGGNLMIKDDLGNFWSLKEGGHMTVGGSSAIPACDATAILLRMDFGTRKWEMIPIQSVQLQPYKSEAAPVPLYWAGNGIFRGDHFIPDNGYSRYFYRVICDRPDIVYAWVRGQGGKVTPVLEAGCTGAVIFGVEPSLAGKKVLPIVDIYNRTQTLKIDNRTYDAVLIGDSITEVWGRNESGFFNTNKYLNKGISGQTSATIRSRFRSDVVDVYPYVVHIMCGTNDVAENDGRYVESSEVVGNITAMAQMAREAGIKVVIGSVFPCNYFSWRGSAWSPGKEGVTITSHIQEINALLKEYCTAEDIPFIDYYSIFVNPDDGSFPLSYDGCHPGSEALKKINQTVKPVIDSLL
ncbi:MAG: endonuclease/exonuclease/phosphatase family protein [Bacteroidales bacterium]|nr:endonuclease/exonuclease/phosphatase family protein [Bacteroidales bacterium]